MLNLVALVAGLWLCRNDGRSLLLLAAVGLAVFAPIFPGEMSPAEWYSALIMIELALVSAAVYAQVKASDGVALVGVGMAVLHIAELATTPFAGQASVYPQTVSGMEFAQILVFSLTQINKKGVYNGIGHC